MRVEILLQRRAGQGLSACGEHADTDVAQLRPEPAEVQRRLRHRGAVEVDEADLPAVNQHLCRPEIVVGGNDPLGRVLDRQFAPSALSSGSAAASSGGTLNDSRPTTSRSSSSSPSRVAVSP